MTVLLCDLGETRFGHQCLASVLIDVYLIMALQLISLLSCLYLCLSGTLNTHARLLPYPPYGVFCSPWDLILPAHHHLYRGLLTLFGPEVFTPGSFHHLVLDLKHARLLSVTQMSSSVSLVRSAHTAQILAFLMMFLLCGCPASL